MPNQPLRKQLYLFQELPSGSAEPKVLAPSLTPRQTSLSLAELSEAEYPAFKIQIRPRLKSSWHVQWTPSLQTGLISVPPVLELAPMAIKRKVFAWAELMKIPKRRWNRDLRERRHQIEEEIRVHLTPPNLSEQQIAHLNPSEKKLYHKIHTRRSRPGKKGAVQGVRHNLRDVFDRVNQRYFEGRLEAEIAWSSRIGGLSTHSSRRAADGVSEKHFISISQGYNGENVSEEILGGVVYHECLHIEIPPVVVGGRRVVHSSEFRRREKQYAHYREWVHWHNTVLRKNLKVLRFKRTMKRLKNKFFAA